MIYEAVQCIMIMMVIMVVVMMVIMMMIMLMSHSHTYTHAKTDQRAHNHLWPSIVSEAITNTSPPSTLI